MSLAAHGGHPDHEPLRIGVGRRYIGFLRLEQRLNVAVSRSRRLIIIVGDTSTLRQGYFHHLVATAQSVGHILPAPKLIGQLLHRGRRLRERDFSVFFSEDEAPPGEVLDRTLRAALRRSEVA